jgi:hypothetical protein
MKKKDSFVYAYLLYTVFYYLYLFTRHFYSIMQFDILTFLKFLLITLAYSFIAFMHFSILLILLHIKLLVNPSLIYQPNTLLNMYINCFIESVKPIEMFLF